MLKERMREAPSYCGVPQVMLAHVHVLFAWTGPTGGEEMPGGGMREGRGGTTNQGQNASKDRATITTDRGCYLYNCS